MRRKVKLKITTASRQSISFLGRNPTARCAACEREVEIITEDLAARILQVTDLALGGLVRAGHVHTIQTISGNRLVCKASIFPNQNLTLRESICDD